MVRRLIELCDLCLADRIERRAKVRYWNDAGEEWHACAKHLKDVEAAGLEYEVIEKKTVPTRAK